MTRRPRLAADLPGWAVTAVLGAVMVGTLAISVAAEDTGALPTAMSDDEPGWDCRTQGDRRCGSDVLRQEPGTYDAPDGGTYTVVARSPYETCILAANTPGPSGFATEVCEPLSPFYEPSDHVYAGPDSWTYQGATIAVPSLAVQIADTCGEGDLRECVEALITERKERSR